MTFAKLILVPTRLEYNCLAPFSFKWSDMLLQLKLNKIWRKDNAFTHACRNTLNSADEAIKSLKFWRFGKKYSQHYRSHWISIKNQITEWSGERQCIVCFVSSGGSAIHSKHWIIRLYILKQCHRFWTGGLRLKVYRLMYNKMSECVLRGNNTFNEFWWGQILSRQSVLFPSHLA